MWLMLSLEKQESEIYLRFIHTRKVEIFGTLKSCQESKVPQRVDNHQHVTRPIE